MPALVLAASTYDMTGGRLTAIVAALVGVIGVVAGGVALGRRRATRGRAMTALAAGLASVLLGGLVVVTADGGLGTGNGLGGGVVAMVIGLIAATLGGLALNRSRRTAAANQPR